MTLAVASIIWSNRFEARDVRLLVIEALDSGLLGGSEVSVLSLDFLSLLLMLSSSVNSGCRPSVLEDTLVLVYSFRGLEAPGCAWTVLSCCEVSTVEWYTSLITCRLSWSHNLIFKGQGFRSRVYFYTLVP